MGKIITFKNIWPLLIVAFFLFPSFSVKAIEKKSIPLKSDKTREELLVVQTVSKDRKSFVVAKGVKDGILKGMEIIYANDSVSIVCKAVEVNRNYSLWTAINPNVSIPFNKEEIITYNSHAYGNVALDIVADINNLTPAQNYDLIYKKFRTKNNFLGKLSLNRALSQSSSDVSNDNNSMRTGYSFGLEYNYRFMPELEMSFGGRIDNEVYRINRPQLDIPTNRVMGVVAATYHFTAFSQDETNFYLSVAAGIGKSTTTVSNEKSTGIAKLLPEARIGYIMPFSPSLAMVFEGAIESIAAKEKFSDDSEQVTSITNVKFSVGLRF